MTTIAGVLAKQNGKYLLVQEKKKEVYGLWNIPAGHVDEGETPENAAKREGLEETGYAFELTSKPKIVTLSKQKIEIYIFTANIIGGEMKLNQEELLAVNWFTPEEISKLKLRTPTFIRLFI